MNEIRTGLITRRYRSFFRAFILMGGISLICSITVWGQGISPEQLKKAKSASVLVVTERGTGTAFCIESISGLFLTNLHVVDAAEKITLVANPGEENEAVQRGVIVAVDLGNDLAVVTASFKTPLTALRIGDDSQLFETQAITSFGYPFGLALAARGKYPAISVNVGRITSLRKRDGQLKTIQTDATINPGNSGGPVIDAKGNVIGIVVAGIAAAQVNFLIPSSTAKRFLSQPLVTMSPSSKDTIDFSEALTFRISVKSLGNLNVADKVILTLGKKPFKATSKGNGLFEVHIPKIENSTKIKLPLKYTLVASKNGREVKSVQGQFVGIKTQVEESKPPMLTKPSAPGGGGWKSGRRTDQSRVFVPPSDVSAIMGLTPSHSVKEKVEISLGTPTSQIAVGGHGRFIVFYFPSSNEIKTFDISTMTMLETSLKFGSGVVILAAGAEDIVAVDPVEMNIAVISLETMEVSRTIKLPWKGSPFHLGMGRSANNRVSISYKTKGSVDAEHDQPHFFDIENMRPFATRLNAEHPWMFRDVRVYFSGDGNVITLCGASYTSMVVFSGSRSAYRRLATDGNSQQIPMLDGAKLIGSTGTVWNLSGQPVAKNEEPEWGRAQYFPSGHPAFYFQLRNEEDGFKGALIANGETHPIVVVGERFAEFGTNEYGRLGIEKPKWDEIGIGLEQRIHISPQLKAIVTIPASNDRLIVRPFDMEKMAAEQNENYLFVSSVPVNSARAGGNYLYKIETISDSKAIKYSVIKGPEGLSVSAEGEVRWSPISGKQGTHSDVLILIQSETGASRYHSFEIGVI